MCWSPEAERMQPEEGEYSHADLIGCRVLGGAEADESAW